MIESLRRSSDLFDVKAEAASNSFFGFSKKQGVSIRYALSSCVPTASCGGRCYAHDGRDRDLQRIARGAFNYYLGQEFEDGNATVRFDILARLEKPIEKAIAWARLDRERASHQGYERLARIRFSHVGEMAATPHFTNALAQTIRRLAPDISCVIYTRHPAAHLLDPNSFVINFTLEGIEDLRKRYAPKTSRLVNSAWDGRVSPAVEVNFLEHHIDSMTAATGSGTVCPVTADHDRTPSCDLARCQKCFVPVSLIDQPTVITASDGPT
jgi:hypothetical protein